MRAPLAAGGESATVNIVAKRVREQIFVIFRAWGMPEDLAATTADIMVETDLWGIDSHGISMLMLYEEMFRQGKLKLDARPRVVRESPVTALIDAGAGLGHPVSAMAMEIAIEKAMTSGVAAVSVFNSHHFGAAGYYARMAAERGLVGLVTSSSRFISVVPTRGTIPVMGTNPIAFAAPARRSRPFVLDMATSTVAANRVKVYSLNGRQLPEGWVVDERGQPVRDADAAMEYIFHRDVGGLTPIGGTPEMGSHKGYGLSVLAQILGATLGGGSFSPIRVKTQRPEDPDNIGHFFLAIDPAAFRMDGAFGDDLDAIIDTLHATPAANASEPVLVAGEPEELTRQRRLNEGIPVPPTLARKIQMICERCDAPFLLVTNRQQGETQ